MNKHTHTHKLDRQFVFALICFCFFLENKLTFLSTRKGAKKKPFDWLELNSSSNAVNVVVVVVVVVVLMLVVSPTLRAGEILFSSSFSDIFPNTLDGRKPAS